MIAIVGMACQYPDANSPHQLWENVLAQRQAFRRFPPERLDLDDYFSADRTVADAIYVTEGAFIEGYAFDRVKFRVAGSAYRSADLTHWLALDVAARAVEDAGLDGSGGLPCESTGVIVGNTLTGEFSRAALMRLRWPYVRRVLDSRLQAEGWEADRRRVFLAELEARYKAPFEPVGEETLAGGLSNTIAGRICNHFNLHGGGYTVDGACSSSLLAISQACQALLIGDMDVALAGGVDLSLDPFELIGFAKTGALADGPMRVYDTASSGFLPGEGCGFLVLMRHEDAMERGLNCRALIRGWGISSDGGGGITRTEVAGQRLALQRAYRRAGYGIDSVSLFEGHGTGTPLGDEVELRTLAELLKGAQASAYIGSIKANIGHTKAAAGAAGMLKTVMALHTQMLPPATGVRKPHRLLADGPLRILDEGRCWPEDRALRAGVSSFGFGGINVHIALESAAATRRKKPSARELALFSSAQDAELFLLAAADRQGLATLVAQLASRAVGLSLAELADLSAWLAGQSGGRGFRAAVVAATPAELAGRLSTLGHWLADGVSARIDTAEGIFLGAGVAKPRIVLLFPGQAAPVRCDGGAMARRFANVKDVYRLAQLPRQADAIATAIAQPAIVAAELAGLALLDQFGVQAERAIGHSLGELTALHWAGAMDLPSLLRIVKQRGQAMTSTPESAGAMASIAADEASVRLLLDNEADAVVAGINAPTQTVISGEARAVARLTAKAEARGLKAMHLPVSDGFHSPLMRPAAERFAEVLRSERFAPLRRPIISTVTGGRLAEAEDLPALLVRQLTSPVRFTAALETALADADLCVEVGPGGILTGLVHASSAVPAISLDCAGGSLRGLFHAVGAAYALGADIRCPALAEGRFSRPFELGQPVKFFANPCESAPKFGLSLSTTQHKPAYQPPPAETADGLPPADTGLETDTLALLRELVARRAELPVAAVLDGHHLLRDLHLNSISVGQIIAEASRQLNLPPPLAPTEFANATLAEAALALDHLRDASNGGQPGTRETIPSGLDAWVLAFAVEKRACPLPAKGQATPGLPGKWRLFAVANHFWASHLLQALEAGGGEGVLLCLPPEDDARHDALLLEAAQAALERDGSPRHLVAVQHGGVAASFIRSLYLEARDLKATLVDVPFSEGAVDWVLAEAQATDGFLEAAYAADGQRFEPMLRPVYLAQMPAEPLLSAQDLLLVSGGGKGIAAESALMLARETGVRLLLLGRASPEGDAELAHNLERFAAAGVVFRYAQADVSDADAVRSAVAAAADLGPVTAILHGAGINQPCALARLDLAALRATQRPKTLGLRNLLAAVDTERLRLLVAFGSVIGRVGLHGEADYALANAQLSRQVEAFQQGHPHCRCLSLEWSIWSGVGMGERLGRVEALLHEGITPITPDQGMECLRRLVAAPAASTSMVVSGRLGAVPPMRLAADNELPFLRFLEHPRLHYPGVELIADAEISSASDPYLEDHVFRGERLLPAVLGLEAMAQAAAALAGSRMAPAFESVEFSQPIVVDVGKTITLRVLALQREPGRIETALRCDQTGFQIDHFRGICAYPQAQETPARLMPMPVAADTPRYIPLQPRQDLYGKLLFHTGRFQRLLGYRSLGAFQCCADIAADDRGSWFARYLPPNLLLGDPGSRDAAIHALQACIPHGIILPVGLDRLLPGDLAAPGPWTVHARERGQDGDEFCYDLDIHAADSRLRERWEGLRLRRVAELPQRGWSEPLLLAYLERRLREWLPQAEIGIALESGADIDPQARAERAMRTLLGTQAVVGRRPDGKPEAEGEKAVAVAHSGDWSLAVAGSAPLACDLEDVGGRETRIWQDLLGEERHRLAGLIVRQAGEGLDLACTRVWTAIECLKKAGLPPNVPLTLSAEAADGWILLGAGKTTIATYRMEPENAPRSKVLAVLCASSAEAGSSASPAAETPEQAKAA